MQVEQYLGGAEPLRGICNRDSFSTRIHPQLAKSQINRNPNLKKKKMKNEEERGGKKEALVV